MVSTLHSTFSQGEKKMADKIGERRTGGRGKMVEKIGEKRILGREKKRHTELGEL